MPTSVKEGHVKLISLMVILSLAAATSGAEDAEPTFDLMPKWTEGTRIEYVITKTRVRSQADATISKAKATKILRV